MGNSTCCDGESLFVDNPINRYSIGKYTEGLKNNTDGSLDIYLQNASPGADKESNWLPTPEGAFSMFLRLYLPQPQVLNGTWQLPLVQKVGQVCNWFIKNPSFREKINSLALGGLNYKFVAKLVY